VRGPRTLRARVALAAAAAILAAVAAFAIATVVLVGNSLAGSLDTALRERAQQVAELAISAPAVLSAPGALESPVSGRQLVVEVIDAGGRILARSETVGFLLPQDRLAHEALVAGKPGYETVSINGRQFRMYAAPIADAGGAAAGGIVLVASDTTDISDTLSHLGFVLTLAGASAALLAALAAAGLTRRGLRPLRRLADAAAEIERTADPSRRLPAASAPDEIGQLTGVLNRMLASLEQARASERRFLADASHELRTPVTTLLGNVEFVARHGADAEVLADLRRDAVRLARLVDDLLVLERAGAGPQERRPIELDELVREAVRGHALADGRLRVGVLEPVRIEADEAAIRRVLDNLIDNALVHGPPNGDVEITLVQRDGRALLTVRDQGSGPEPAHVERMFERFWRGPDTSDRPGSGLGLSIVAAIVERHGGQIEVQGPAFTVALPAAGRGGPIAATGSSAAEDRQPAGERSR
jgi:two-component system sensor histidine kinase MprB